MIDNKQSQMIAIVSSIYQLKQDDCSISVGSIYVCVSMPSMYIVELVYDSYSHSPLVLIAIHRKLMIDDTRNEL